ncbi:MAG: DNA-directed RNA polymerase subunit A' [Candidatus Aenigmarchaeota archaeon CG_4_9_14_3_um_filter_37_18]|nr:DNA-directed RNA polymerase subunit A' [Candidatus Aenigmarchaeota archaeon]PIV69348.1 MAG: DNA-directed RNA polymerase subunit A' [Candidatus Aenigmarchaeota archaeon CG01_land_8_20_14_3_00_37_9]PIW41433.1 MAG: DNA-directed RNA polymerase subunit A' [Candidatus Aenigmarchaeota archaeon CG15_BIG_FIL_POST_REV_8_21_14_020_37_27]PIY34851.1 MAG: DNA-directed RNA polymerase subunit A' [Candidatus Aenigmarchaeota archaeon CG_4_10_14_3_um_filter_37_21]PJB75686.1 MAG: DNA-directed RNA polymerase sub
MIDKIVFGVLDPEIIKKMSAAKLSKTELYDQEGYPVEGGLMDPRLGTIDPGLRCRTCSASIGECPGHFGFLELTKPVVNVLYAKLVYNLLGLTCRKCGRILADGEGMEKFKNGKKSLKKLKNIVKPKCPFCGEKQKKIKFLKPSSFVEGASILSSLDVRERLERIPNEDLPHLGIKNTRPEYFIITLLPVPPVTMRPSITLETGERSEDDLTHKLVDIVRINKRLRENIDLGAPDFIIQDLWELLQYHISTYINNEITGVPPARHRSGRILKTLTQRLKAKDGRFRHNLIGKRVNFSARTVVSPDPMLDIDEVGVPLEIAKELTIPVVIEKKNVKYIQKLIENYPDWPTVNYVIRPDGRRKKVAETNKKEIAEEIEVGYTVEKQLENGDWVIFNRQPSLHRMSMMGHRVRVMPYKTFRLNPTVCPPYNADFDGDEMNIHIPQTKEAQAETELLTAVATQMRSPRFSGPIIGPKNDYITGFYLLTNGDRSFTRENTVRIVRACDIDIEIPEKKTFTGKEIFSLFLPKDFNFEYGSKSDNVVIKNGKLISGTIDGRGISAFKGKILDEVDKKYGHTFAKKFLFNMTKLAIEILSIDGFTLSLSEHELNEKANKKIEQLLKDTQEFADNLIKDFEKGKIKLTVEKNSEEAFEIIIKKELAETLNKVTKIVKDEIPENNLILMAKSGSRGSIVNIVQSSAMIGQETVKNDRIKIGFHDRTFSHFKKGDKNMESKGFVTHGYKQGLSPFEFFFDAMNSREGLMDKSLKTRHSGYLERRLVGALKDLKVDYDGTVRDSGNKIVQFVAGEDGLDPSKIQKGGINVKRISEEIIGK